MESLLIRFLWKGGNQNENKLPLVSWGKVTKPYTEGGLQIRDLRSQNLALGAKFSGTWSLENSPRARTPYGRNIIQALEGSVLIQRLKSQKDRQYSQSVKKHLGTSIPI